MIERAVANLGHVPNLQSRVHWLVAFVTLFWAIVIGLGTPIKTPLNAILDTWRHSVYHAIENGRLFDGGYIYTYGIFGKLLYPTPDSYLLSVLVFALLGGFNAWRCSRVFSAWALLVVPIGMLFLPWMQPLQL